MSGAYVSTKCAGARHCDCVTGPYLQSGGVARRNTGTNEHCACHCHALPGATREMFDRQHMDARAAGEYARRIAGL